MYIYIYMNIPTMGPEYELLHDSCILTMGPLLGLQGIRGCVLGT